LILFLVRKKTPRARRMQVNATAGRAGEKKKNRNPRRMVNDLTRSECAHGRGKRF
jgi:hypothetical protein